MKKLILLMLLCGCHKKSSDSMMTTDAGSQFKAHIFADQSILNVILRPNGIVWGCYEPMGDTGEFYCGYLTKQKEQ